MDYSKLSKEVSYALRHAPWAYELELDTEGWVPVEQLLSALNEEKQWDGVQQEDLVLMIERSDKKRHELLNGKIRALYGHSVPEKISKTPEAPPPVLYHGTARRLIERIRADGLKPMNRQYVHLSSDIQTAVTVGKRKDDSPIILQVDAARAWAEGVAFYRGNHMIWLADAVSPAYLKVNP
ncbi:RNA 2'-phosphotransferase [Paenibacillus daejeonensis]|uniref:RNA 2'-phosphotransferase n=1 Tax=Paenibacillus daejeonensis TaxID=135193 RepID=UPI00036C4377|nr:RNA 2'-phosphotransferase [Paenibacillus daejeonensis]